MPSNNAITISDVDYQSIALKFQSVDLAIRGLKQMIDEEGHIDHYDIDAVNKIYRELYEEFQELSMDNTRLVKESSHE